MSKENYRKCESCATEWDGNMPADLTNRQWAKNFGCPKCKKRHDEIEEKEHSVESVSTGQEKKKRRYRAVA